MMTQLKLIKPIPVTYFLDSVTSLSAVKCKPRPSFNYVT